MTASLAAMLLVVIGAVVAILGFIIAGNITLVALGLLAVFGGGVLATIDRRQT